MTKKIDIKRTHVPIDKLVTMAELGLGAVRPLNKEKKGWIRKSDIIKAIKFYGNCEYSNYLKNLI